MITYAQIDVNGFCNSKCWFCPVAYVPNPKRGKTNMSLETLEYILKQLRDGTGDFVNIENPFSTVHFNEPLLYPYLEEMLLLYKKYGFTLGMFSNGTNITPERVDILKKYPDVVVHFTLNIPSAFKEEWSQLTGFNQGLFDKVMNNVRYAVDNLKFLWDNNNHFTLQVNTVTEKSLPENGGIIELMPNAPKIDLDLNTGHQKRNMDKFKEMFPEIYVGSDYGLVNRNGYLEKLNVMSNARGIEKLKGNKSRVIGCIDKMAEETIFINAAGDVFFCYNDYEFTTIYGNIHEKTIKNIWYSKEHSDMIEKSFSNFCIHCPLAVWE